MTNGSKSEDIGKVSDVPVLFEKMEAKLDFVGLSSVPFDVVVGRKTLKWLGGVLDFRAEDVRSHY